MLLIMIQIYSAMEYEGVELSYSQPTIQGESKGYYLMVHHRGARFYGRDMLQSPLYQERLVTLVVVEAHCAEK